MKYFQWKIIFLLIIFFIFIPYMVIAQNPTEENSLKENEDTAPINTKSKVTEKLIMLPEKEVSNIAVQKEEVSNMAVQEEISNDLPEDQSINNQDQILEDQPIKDQDQKASKEESAEPQNQKASQVNRIPEIPRERRIYGRYHRSRKVIVTVESDKKLETILTPRKDFEDRIIHSLGHK